MIMKPNGYCVCKPGDVYYNGKCVPPSFCPPGMITLPGGMRYALDNSEVMIHQPMGGISGQAVDMEIEARRILRIRESINKILSKHSGQSIDRVRLDSDRNFWLTGREAKDYGLVDEVLPARKSGASWSDGRWPSPCCSLRHSRISACALRGSRTF